MDKEIEILSNNELSEPLIDTVKKIRVGKEILNAARAELRALDQIGDANNVRAEKLEKAQIFAEELLDAEIELCESIWSEGPKLEHVSSRETYSGAGSRREIWKQDRRK